MNSKKPSDESEKLLTINSLLHDYSQILRSVSAGLDACTKSIYEMLDTKPFDQSGKQSPRDGGNPHSD